MRFDEAVRIVESPLGRDEATLIAAARFIIDCTSDPWLFDASCCIIAAIRERLWHEDDSPYASIEDLTSQALFANKAIGSK